MNKLLILLPLAFLFTSCEVGKGAKGVSIDDGAVLKNGINNTTNVNKDAFKAEGTANIPITISPEALKILGEVKLEPNSIPINGKIEISPNTTINLQKPIVQVDPSAIHLEVKPEAFKLSPVFNIYIQPGAIVINLHVGGKVINEKDMEMPSK